MRLIDADALLNLPFEKMIHTDYGDTCVPIEEIENAPTVNPTFKPICEVNLDKEELQRMVDEKAKEIVKELESEDDAIQYTKGYQDGFLEGKKLAERPQGEWIVTAEDSEGIHRIQCPFCRYEMGSDFIDYIIVTFEKFPPFCEKCGADMRGKKNEIDN